jgi:hypothetical protein
MAITSAKFAGLNYNVGVRKYSVKLDLEVGASSTSKFESAAVWEDSGEAAQAGERAVTYLVENGVLPDMSQKWWHKNFIMGFYKNLEFDVIQMYKEDGLREHEIAKVTGLSLTQIHEVLSAYERREMDYDESDEIVSYDDLNFEPTEPEDYE